MPWNSTGKKSNGIAKTSVEMERQSMEMTGDGVAKKDTQSKGVGTHFLEEQRHGKVPLGLQWNRMAMLRQVMQRNGKVLMAQK